jgi:hypothetical protein
MDACLNPTQYTRELVRLFSQTNVTDKEYVKFCERWDMPYSRHLIARKFTIWKVQVNTPEVPPAVRAAAARQLFLHGSSPAMENNG